MRGFCDVHYLMIRVFFCFFCLLTIPSRANLGETVAQCVARYGRPVGYSEAGAKNPFGTVAFAAGGYTLIVFLVGDKEVGARVSKQDKSVFSDAEMKTIMDADSGGSPWSPAKSPDPSCLSWSRADQATVLYDKDKHVLIFTAKAMTDALHNPQAPTAAPAPIAPEAAAKPAGSQPGAP
jgi:hypothetical protein